MSIKQAEEFLKKTGSRKKVSKFEKHKEDIIYLYHEGASLEIITQYLETKGVTRAKGYNALSSFVKRNLGERIVDMKAKVFSGNLEEQESNQTINANLNPVKKAKRRYSSEPSKRDMRIST